MAIKSFLNKIEVAKLRRLGFTVSGATSGGRLSGGAGAPGTITGGTDALLKKHICGGARRLAYLKQLTMRA